MFEEDVPLRRSLPRTPAVTPGDVDNLLKTTDLFPVGVETVSDIFLMFVVADFVWHVLQVCVVPHSPNLLVPRVRLLCRSSP
jgi:hypothetical protein